MSCGTITSNRSLSKSLQIAIINSGEAGANTPEMVRMKLSKESVLLICIGVLDLVSTLIWVNHHGAQEANPIFRTYLELGPMWFALMKIVMLAAPIYLLEWAGRRRPEFTRFASRFAVGAYLLMYVVGVAKLNPQLIHPKPQRLTLALYDGMDFGKAELPNESSIRDYKPGTAEPYNDSPVLTEGLH